MSKRPPRITKDLDVTFRNPDLAATTLTDEQLFRHYLLPYQNAFDVHQSSPPEGFETIYRVPGLTTMISKRSRAGHSVRLFNHFLSRELFEQKNTALLHEWLLEGYIPVDDPEFVNTLGTALRGYITQGSHAPTPSAPFIFINQLSTAVRTPVTDNTEILHGANHFVLLHEKHRNNHQRLIISEAPYSAEDYFRMILHGECRVLVSLSTDEDNEKGRIKALRFNTRVDLHHLEPGESLKLKEVYLRDPATGKPEKHAEVIITNVNEETPHPGEPVTVKHLQVSVPSRSETFTIPHIVFKGWLDNQAVTHGDLIRIIELINRTETGRTPMDTAPPPRGAEYLRQVLNASFPVCINCVYGHGRSNTLALAYHIYHMMHEHIDNEMNKLKGPRTPQRKINVLEGMKKRLNVNLEPMFNAIQMLVAYRAVVAENPQVTLLETFPEGILDHEIEKLRQVKQALPHAERHAPRRDRKGASGLSA